MQLRQGYIPVGTQSPLLGVNKALPPNRLDSRFASGILNGIVRDGFFRRRPGGVQLGRRLVGTVLAITEFGELGEDPYMVVLTSHRQYAYNPVSGDFVDLTPGQTTYTLTGVDQGTDTFTISGNHAGDFTVGQLFPVVGGPNEGVYTLASATDSGGDTEIVVEEEIPSPTVSGDIVLATDFETPELNTIEFASLTDTNGHRLLITNGSDTPRTWDGDIGTPFADWAPNFTNFVTMKSLAVFNEHLMLGNVTTTTEETQLVAWSSAGDFDEFEDGDSGVQLLYPFRSPILHMELLGDRLAIYSKDTIMTSVFVGLPAVFAFEVVIPEGTRLVSQKAITSINVGHIFLSEQAFYLFDGTRGLRPLSDNVVPDYKLVKDHALLYRVATINDHSKRTIYIAVPDISGGSVVYTLYYDVFDLNSLIWAKEKYQDDVRAWGFFTNRNEEIDWEDASWEEVDMPWEDELGDWLEEGEQLNFPIRTYGTSEGRVILVTEGVLPDRGVAGDQLYDTPDFLIPEVDQTILGRWTEIEFEAWGTNVDVRYSTDQGANRVFAETVQLDGNPQVYRVYIDTIGRSLRVRFISNTEFKLRWVRVWVKPQGPR